MITDLTNLQDLPKPEVIESLDYEVILQRRKDQLATLAPELAEYLGLETEPMVVLLEEASYAELLLRNRINHAYRARLLWFATGSDLDHVAEESGVTRLPGESDEDLRTRVRIKNRGSSSAGPDDWWRFHAMDADEQVEDVSVYRVPIGPDQSIRGLVRLSILAKTPDGVPTAETLAAVRERVESLGVRNVCAAVEVVAAASKVFDVTAKIWRLPGSDASLVAGLEATLREEFAKIRAMGYDIAPSWIVAVLQQAGVQRVELLSPTALVEVGPHEAPRIGTVSIEDMGVAS